MGTAGTLDIQTCRQAALKTQNFFFFLNWRLARQWWLMPLIPALGRQRQADFWVRGQPGLRSEFQDSQGYVEKSCLGEPKEKKKQKRKHGNVMDVEEPSPLTVTSYSSSYWRVTPQMWRVAKCFTLELKFQNIHTGQKPYKYEECLLASLYPCVPSNYFEMLTIYYPQAQML